MTSLVFKVIPIVIQNLLPMCLQLCNALAVKIKCLGDKEICECLTKVCLICEAFSMKVVVQGIKEVAICWHKVRGVCWMTQHLPSQVALWYPWPPAPWQCHGETVEYTLTINQCWLLVPQCLLHTL